MVHSGVLKQAERRRAMAGFLVKLALALLLLSGGALAKPRVASINLCGDQVLLALADREQIVSLGPFARDKTLSAAAEKAGAFPRNSGAAEAVLIGEPDLIIIGPYDNAQTRRLIAASGTPVFTLPPWRGFEAGYQDIRALARAIEQPEAGEGLIARIEAARLAARGYAAQQSGRRALAIGRGGYVDGTGGIIASLMEEAGLTDILAEKTGDASAGRFLPLETVLMLKPDTLVLGEGSLAGQDRKAQFFAHPAFRKAFGAAHVIILPERLTACGGPSLIEALEHFPIKWLPVDRRKCDKNKKIERPT